MREQMNRENYKKSNVGLCNQVNEQAVKHREGGRVSESKSERQNQRVRYIYVMHESKCGMTACIKGSFWRTGATGATPAIAALLRAVKFALYLFLNALSFLISLALIFLLLS